MDVVADGLCTVDVVAGDVGLCTLDVVADGLCTVDVVAGGDDLRSAVPCTLACEEVEGLFFNS